MTRLEWRRLLREPDWEQLDLILLDVAAWLRRHFQYRAARLTLELVRARRGVGDWGLEPLAMAVRPHDVLALLTLSAAVLAGDPPEVRDGGRRNLAPRPTGLSGLTVPAL